MRKLLTLFIALCLFPLLGNAQSLVDEDFGGTTGTTPPTGWTQNRIAGDTVFDNWNYNNPGVRTLNAPISDPAAIFDSDNLSQNGGAEDVALESPAFDASALSMVLLEFDHYFQSGFGGGYNVEVYDGTAWVSVLTGGASSTANPQHEILDITTAAAGATNAQVRFRWTGNYSWYWILDNVEVFAPVQFPNDVATLSASTSAVDGACNGSAETVTIQVTNLGTAAATTIGASFAVDGGTPSAPELIPGTLNPGDTLIYTFTATADLSAGGAHTIDAGATVLGDGDNTNDTATVAVSTAASISAPFTEDFETGVVATPGTPPVGWTQSPASGFTWYVESDGTTNSSSTGPLDDHTNGGQVYMYTEASSGSLGSITELSSPCIDLSALTAPRLGYWYHMYGAAMGKLYVDVVAGGIRTRIDSVVGQVQTDQNDPWLEKRAVLDAYIGQTIQLIFVGERGSSFTSDISLDDVAIFEADPFDVAASNGSIDLNCDNAGAALVSVRVTNLGTMPATGISVDYAIDGAASIPAETIGGSLAAGGDTLYVFTTTADLSVVGPHAIDMSATVASDGDASNDSTSAGANTSPVLSAPFVEDFETGIVATPGTPPAGWTQSPPSGYTWYVESDGTTNSTGTGPLDDHTPGGSIYMYTEASSGGTGDITELTSPCLDLSAVSVPKLRYWYHMFGSDMGTLLVDVISNSGRTTIDTISGQQQANETDPWLERVIDMSAYAGQSVQLVFVGIHGSSFRSDMSIDDVEIFQPPAFDLELTSLNLTNGCGLSAAEQVMITVTNAGTDTLMSASAQFSVDAGAYSAVETITGPMAPGASVNYTFTATADLSAIGAHTVDAVATAATPADLNTANDSASASSNNVMLISPVFPYQENFDSGPAGWMASGANSSWVLTTPNKAVIDTSSSAPNSWVNGDTTGIYNANEQSFVTSPCIDMTNAPAGSWVSMKIWWESEFSWDGAALQVSSDAGSTWSTVGNAGDPFNWYTDNTINGNPGGQQQGWTGRNGTGSNGWVLAAHSLDTTVIGQANVRFRIAFGSDGSVHDDGFAFDDFTISQAPMINFADSMVVCGPDMLDAGNPGSTYDWSTGDSTQTLSIMNTTGMNIIDSVITLTVTDSFGLMVTDSISLTMPASIPSGMAMVSDSILCNSDSTGGVMVTPMGGTAPYTYTWDTSDSTSMVGNLPAGTYSVTVADSFGCSFDAMATIVEPTALDGTLDTVVNVNCPNDSTGMIAVTITGGTGAYTYLWSNGDTNEDPMMLPVGDYTGTVTDANGCTASSDIITIAALDTFPVANFDYLPGDVNYEISFTDMSSDADSVMWDFGDGNTSTDASPTYVFATNDTFIVSLTATNDCGTSTKTDTIIVTNVSIEDDLLSQAVQVYPNPNSGNFEVKFAGITLDKVVLRVSNAAGQMVYTRNIGQVRGNYTHAVSLPSSLAAGLYILEVRTPEAVMHKRLLIK